MTRKQPITQYSRFHPLAVGTVALLMLISLMLPAQERQRWWHRQVPEPTPPQIIHTRHGEQGLSLELSFEKGPSFNHPLMAVWIEDAGGQYLRTLYVAESIAKGEFRHGDPSSGRWMPGPIRRPAALPYWGHQRGEQASDGLYIPESSNPMPDALTGPTPKGDFVLHSHAPQEVPRQFRLLFEINQSWDWNEYWTNNKFPGDRDYMTSSQPALVYKALIDLDDGQQEYELQPIGHSHWSGSDGRLFEDLGTITTALEITKSLRVRIQTD